MITVKKKTSWVKRILIGGLILLLAGAIAVWFIFNEKFTDTKERKAAYTVKIHQLVFF